MLDVIHYKKFQFTELQGNLPCSEKTSWNSCHESKHIQSKLPISFY